MDATEQKRQIAWQPFTFSGVAAFGDATIGRLLTIQLVFAVLIVGVVVWLLQLCWFPVARDAIRHLPGTGEVRSGRLDWHADSPILLAKSRFLSIAVDLRHEGVTRSAAHVQIEFGESDIKVISLLGFLKLHYPKGWIIACNREELQPWWGAWSPIILGVTALLGLAALFLFWAFWALVLVVPTWITALFCDRALTFAGAWRIVSAAQLPGALLLAATLFFYGLRVVDPVRVLAAVGLQTVMLFIYAFGSQMRRPKIGEKKSNPFKPASTPPVAPAVNPFSSTPPAPPSDSTVSEPKPLDETSPLPENPKEE